MIGKNKIQNVLLGLLIYKRVAMRHASEKSSALRQIVSAPLSVLFKCAGFFRHEI